MKNIMSKRLVANTIAATLLASSLAACIPLVMGGAVVGGTLVAALYGGLQTVHVDAQVRYEDGRTGSISADLKIRNAKTFPRAAAKRAA